MGDSSLNWRNAVSSTVVLSNLYILKAGLIYNSRFSQFLPAQGQRVGSACFFPL